MKDERKTRKTLLSHGKDIKWLKENVATKSDLVRIYESLSDHEMRLTRIEENMATKQDLVAMENRMNITMDKVLEIVTRNSHEFVMLKHIVEEHDNVIRQMKPRLGMA